MKKQKSSSGGKVMIILTGLTFMAVLVGGVTWSMWIKKPNTYMPRQSAAQRMKVLQIPEAIRMKIPPVPSQMEHARRAVESSLFEATANPVTSTAIPDPSPPQEVIEPAAKPMSQLEEETLDTVDVDKTPSDTTDTAAGDTPEPETAEVVQPVQEASQAPPPDAPSKEAPQPAAETATTTERFNLQVGAFCVEQYARERAAKLSQKGYAPFILEITDARRRTWYTVRIGRYENREEAAAALESFKRNENFDAVIVKTRKL